MPRCGGRVHVLLLLRLQEEQGEHGLAQILNYSESRRLNEYVLMYIDETYTFDGLVVFGLLVICTCAYMRRVPRLKQWFLSEKKGFWGVFYKASVIGTRLHFFVSVSCVLAGCYLLFIK